MAVADLPPPTAGQSFRADSDPTGKWTGEADRSFKAGAHDPRRARAGPAARLPRFPPLQAVPRPPRPPAPGESRRGGEGRVGATASKGRPSPIRVTGPSRGSESQAGGVPGRRPQTMGEEEGMSSSG